MNLVTRHALCECRRMRQG